MNSQKQRKIYKLSIFLPALCFCTQSAYSADWGYENDKEPESIPKTHPKPDQAPVKKPLLKRPKAEPVEQRATPGKLVPDAKPAPKPESKASLSSVTKSWLEMLGLINQASGELPEKFPPDKLPTQLQGDQRERFETLLNQNNKDPEVAKIQNYWPTVRPFMNDVDHRDNYRLLFRSLLRTKASKLPDQNPLKEMIQESLGPDRIAISGNTSLSEDAIGAYTDMTCLLYEKTHPGKTVDADDNRAVFAQLVRNKFEHAPTEADKKAMNAFPLTWSIFRILYTSATDEERDKMSKELAQGGKFAHMKITDKTLALVLSQFPKDKTASQTASGND
ncbi:MAG: hypothetical protein KIT34_10345 [Cyanobacteria bacterium TGS_CYA1]|nr:hypothetical protein [Cyanobacteria bacterium TGS_CYA1]